MTQIPCATYNNNLSSKTLCIIFCVVIQLNVFSKSLSRAQIIPNNKIIFIREFREYDWKVFDNNHNKLTHPIQVLKDYYKIEYQLNHDSVIVVKLAVTPPYTRIIISAARLSSEQEISLKKIVHTANFSTLEKQCNQFIADDGFYLDIKIIRKHDVKVFRWNGNYIPELINLLDMVNSSSPEKYLFYPTGGKDTFRRQLPDVTNTH